MKITEKVFTKLKNKEEVFWENEEMLPYEEAKKTLKFTEADIEDARARLERFAPLIMKYFPETKEANGIIESELLRADNMKKELGCVKGDLFVKLDSHLPIGGSVKARGGIYEVLKHTEDLALEAGFLTKDSGPEDYLALADHKDYFSKYKVQVGSTGNLGLSIGIMSAAIGFEAIVHMSADAKEWKKKRLRDRGVKVMEYEQDYSRAVEEGRKSSEKDPMSYFVDDESSSSLYLGYAVVGKRIAKQLEDAGVKVDADHKLAVHIPCGVGGAPGGIAFGLKEIYGDNVNVYFAEPTNAPCMLVGVASGKGDKTCVQDYGLTGKTEADGLAVSRCSALVAGEMAHTLSGVMTVDDSKLYDYMKLLRNSEGYTIEPSSCAAFNCVKLYCDEYDDTNVTHIAWATGGKFVPDEVIAEYLKKVNDKNEY